MLDLKHVVIGTVLASSVMVGPSAAKVECARCYIDSITYFDDASCTNVTGYIERTCSGAVHDQWGSTSGHYQWYQEGGESLCGCDFEDPPRDYWSASGSVGCQ